MPRALAILTAVTLAACSHAGVDTPPSSTGPVGTTWYWHAFEDSADGAESGDIRVPDPASYTLTLATGGRAEIRADCNRVSWGYTLDGSRLIFDTLGPSTLAFCGEDSLDQRFLQRLGETRTHVLADGKLYLNLMADAGNLVFESAN